MFHKMILTKSVLQNETQKIHKKETHKNNPQKGDSQK